jgi:putative protein-disulfide isomerase
MSIMQPELFYIADPMCSWCWGFSPIINRIKDKFNDAMKMNLVVGGLRVGGTQAMSDELRKTLAHHWEEVEKASSQPFNYAFNMPESFIYNTEPSCRAVVTVRKLDPDKTFPYFKSLHQAFYAENRDITQTDILLEIAEDTGIAPEDFLETFTHGDTLQETREDFEFSQSLGIRGFPSIVLKDERGLALLTRGYLPYEDLEPNLTKWVETGRENRATAK